MASKTIDHILELVRSAGVVRPRDLHAAGLPREYLSRMERQGLLERTGRGLYQLPDTGVTENHGLVTVAKLVPHGVVCLLSALRFHGVTTQNPTEVWLALARGSRPPRFSYPPLRVSFFSGEAFTAGIEGHLLEGVAVRIYSPPKTIADCFKFRNRIGIDVAAEALEEGLGQGKTTVEEIVAAARVCRVENVMRPYIEALA